MTTPTLTTAPKVWPLAGTRCYFRGHLMDYETAAFLMAMEAELGYSLTVLQGCYTSSNASSAGTHDGGGVIDLAPWDWENKVRVARELGGFAWHRPYLAGQWPEHIHFGIRNHPTLAPAARQQQTYFDQKPRKNGLAGEPVDPDQTPGRPTPTFIYPPKKVVLPTFSGVSLNDNFGNLSSDVAATIAAVRPLIMGVQEGWRVHYKDVIPPRWQVGQTLENDATAGVAVIWDDLKLKRLGRSEKPHQLGHGWQAVGKGADTRVRGVRWRDLSFRDNVPHGDLDPEFRLACVHRPPLRDHASWEAFDHALALWVKRSPLPVILFMDSNEHGGPSVLLDLLSSRYQWHGEGIDGAVSALPVKRIKALPKRTSDHRAVVVTLG